MLANNNQYLQSPKNTHIGVCVCVLETMNASAFSCVFTRNEVELQASAVKFLVVLFTTPARRLHYAYTTAPNDPETLTGVRLPQIHDVHDGKKHDFYSKTRKTHENRRRRRERRAPLRNPFACYRSSRFFTLIRRRRVGVVESHNPSDLYDFRRRARKPYTGYRFSVSGHFATVVRFLPVVRPKNPINPRTYGPSPANPTLARISEKNASGAKNRLTFGLESEKINYESGSGLRQSAYRQTATPTNRRPSDMSQHKDLFKKFIETTYGVRQDTYGHYKFHAATDGGFYRVKLGKISWRLEKSDRGRWVNTSRTAKPNYYKDEEAIATVHAGLTRAGVLRVD